jgi:hypothetical protein
VDKRASLFKPVRLAVAVGDAGAIRERAGSAGYDCAGCAGYQPRKRETPNGCQRIACGFAAPLVGDEQTATSIQAGVDTFGRLLAWAVVRAHDGAHDAGRRPQTVSQRS